MQRTHVLRRAMPPTAVLLVCFVSATLLGVAGVTPSARGQTTENEAIRWNAIASTAILAAAPAGAGQAPQAGVLSLAMVQGAVYDAVNAIDGGYQPYLVAPPADPGDSKEAAAATAAFRVLVGFPANTPPLTGLVPGQLSTLQPLYDASLAGVPDGSAKDGGIEVGEAAAAAMLTNRQNDGRFGSFKFVPRHRSRRLAARSAGGSERDRRSGPDPLGRLRPAVPGPGRRHAPDRRPERPHERRVRGGLQRGEEGRLPDQRDAHRGSDGGGDLLAGQRDRDLEPRLPELALGRGLDIVDSARLFAMTNLAGADASIGCWNDKAFHSFWRPITAIREAASDGNPATAADPTWVPLFDPTVAVSGAPLVTPGFPDHPSGHACISSAVVNTLKEFFGTDKVSFTATSNKCLPAPCPGRTFERFSLALKEVIDARVWSGIHFRTADVQGAVLGKKVEHYMEKYFFEPVS